MKEKMTQKRINNNQIKKKMKMTKKKNKKTKKQKQKKKLKKKKVRFSLTCSYSTWYERSYDEAHRSHRPGR